MHGNNRHVLFYFGTWGSLHPEGSGVSQPRVRSVAENDPDAKTRAVGLLRPRIPGDVSWHGNPWFASRIR